ncbi:hypothetical protein [Steroidobacter sp.]|uniref:hypothetical protein n=1 Tax=Steroidobacter sp. TaxID=1978227 RepID=UPI001A5D9B8D|nr:hypothetical protein [Steroidobacter sp.]MBL8269018.1 hypothetical protein [Steroidobacter sp.]
MKMIRVLPAAALTFVVGAAFAHKGMHGPGAKFDADGSEDLSLAEYTEYLKAATQDVAAAADKFAKLDRDKNGALSSAEFIAGLSKDGAAKSNQ